MAAHTEASSGGGTSERLEENRLTCGIDVVLLRRRWALAGRLNSIRTAALPAQQLRTTHERRFLVAPFVDTTSCAPAGLLRGSLSKPGLPSCSHNNCDGSADSATPPAIRHLGINLNLSIGTGPLAEERRLMDLSWQGA
jgi:hypothetical protein